LEEGWSPPALHEDVVGQASIAGVPTTPVLGKLRVRAAVMDDGSICWPPGVSGTL
jgi:hypothetical protein